MPINNVRDVVSEFGAVFMVESVLKNQSSLYPNREQKRVLCT